MGKILLTLEIGMDKVKTREIQMLEVTLDEISLTLVQLENIRNDLLRKREMKRRMEEMPQW